MYGIAFDLGTTSIVAYLCDLDKGQIIETLIKPNPQIEYGLDVLSRVSFMNDNPDGKNILATSLSGVMLDMSAEFLSSKDCIAPAYKRMVIVANPIIMSTISNCSFSELSDEIIRLPAIGGYVGADALAASYMVWSEQKKDSVDLMIDIGTNTEMVLMTPNGSWATSAAAGPALEGGNIVCGMAASDGAIDKFSLTHEVNTNSDIIFHTIDEHGSGIFPIGICGSGMLSLIQTLLKCGAIDRTGYLYSSKEALSKNVPLRIANRIHDTEGFAPSNASSSASLDRTRYIRLTDEVLVFQEDIRAIQLALAAIRAGEEILISKANLTREVNINIYLAGAFGNKLSVENATELGLLPSYPNIKIVQAGNLAGLGAVSILLAPYRIEEAIAFNKNIKNIQLANEPTFQNEFIKYMDF